MARRNFRFALAAVILALAAASTAFFSSCSSKIGWGVVLWTAPDGPLPAGAVVPVFIKSNIEQVYVVGVPGSKPRGKKIELPLWQVKLFGGRGKAQAFVKSMGENVSLYMIAARDGLPLRDKPSNSAKRVYRMREGQSVKILQKVEGDEVRTGGKVLSGSWYQVLADDGSEGYAFSYAFRVYDEAKEGPPVLASEKKSLSGRADIIFSRSWRPEYFQEMVEDGRVDLDYFSMSYGLFIDAIRRQVRLELPAVSKLFNYSDVVEADGAYSFEGTALRVRIESDSRIVCDWSGKLLPSGGEAGSSESAEDAAARADASAKLQAEADEDDQDVENGAVAGSRGSATFVAFPGDLAATIRSEVLRRQRLLSSFVDSGGSWGSPSDQSGSGLLIVEKNGRFVWKGRGDAASDIVPANLSGSGEAAIRLFLDTSLSSSWEGALSLRFDQGDDSAGGAPRKWINLLYRHSPAGLVLAAAAPPVDLTVRAQAPGAGTLVLAAAK